VSQSRQTAALVHQVHILVNASWGIHVAKGKVQQNKVLAFDPGNSAGVEIPRVARAWLRSAIKVLKGVFGNHDGLAEAVMPFVDVVLELLQGSVIPVDAGVVPLTFGAIFLEILHPSIPIGVGACSGTAELVSVVTEGLEVLPPKPGGVRGAQIRLELFLRFIETKEEWRIGFL